MLYRPDPTFQGRIRKAFGEAGKDWLKALPETLAKIAKRWDLRLGEVRDPLAYNFVCEAKQADGQEAMLKIGVPSTENGNEVHALELFGGQGYVTLLRSDAQVGALLLERLRPGKDVLSVEGDEAQTLIVARVLKAHPILTEELKGFPSVSDWGQGFKRVREIVGESGLPVSSRLFERAQNTYRELCDSGGEASLLHGDLHHMNILSSGDNEWKVIDPQGVVGERAYAVGAWMRSPLHLMKRHNAKALIQRRIAILEDQLGVEQERMKGWAFSQCVLAACWALEDRDESVRWFAEWAEELYRVFYPRSL